MKILRMILIAGFALVTAVACQKSDDKAKPRQLTTESSPQGLRPLTPREAEVDFDFMVNTFRDQYGPLEYKEQRFDFSFENWAAQNRARLKDATSDAEIFAVFAEFLTKFQDGHVSIGFRVNNANVNRYSIPIFLTPVAGKALVADVPAGLASEIRMGDEVLTIDGETPAQLLAKVLKYRSWATPESNEHLMFAIFNRDFHMVDLIPKKNAARVTFKKPDGKVLSEDFIWKVQPWTQDRFVEDVRVNLMAPMVSELQDAAGASLLTMAKPVPFFATEQVKKKYGFIQVTANEEFRKKYGLADSEKPDIFAALYRFNGKNILLVRNFVYSHQDFSNAVYMKGYKAVLDQWDDVADVLVLDQTHNGGGSYCEEFFQLFINESKDAFVQSCNVDRKWITDFKVVWPEAATKAKSPVDLIAAYRAMGSTVEQAYDRGELMSDPVPIMGGGAKVGPLDYSWKKPMLVLVDELAGSCGDAYPMLIKNNNVAKIFGKRTMGLGGNVEVFILPISQTRVSLTRGLFTSNRDDKAYTPELMVENNGVIPDYPYEHTVEDFRAGFVAYVKTFSEKALEQIKPTAE